jgi:hypothetical protein
MSARGAGQAHDAAADAAAALYGMPLASFTAERNRLAAELKQEGAVEASRAVAKLGKPSVSAWVVNRIYREARGDLDALLEAGGRMRAGDASASRDQRAVLSRLHKRAAEILERDGHAASPAMLRRVTTTLQALSAIGSFDPDPPGQLVQDRDPPGFDLLAGVPLPPAPPEKKADKAKKSAKKGEATQKAEKAAREEEPPDPAARQRQQRAAAQRKMLERSAAQASKRADARAQALAELRSDMERAQAKYERLRDAVERAEAELDEARTAADAAIRALDEEPGSP